jgi:hypothetical protein
LSIIAEGALGDVEFGRMSSLQAYRGEPRLFAQPGFFIGGPIKGPPSSWRESSCHDRRRLSSATSRNRCRPLVPRFFANAFVSSQPVARFFISAVTVIAASVIAAPVVAKKRGGAVVRAFCVPLRLFISAHDVKSVSAHRPAAGCDRRRDRCALLTHG